MTEHELIERFHRLEEALRDMDRRLGRLISNTMEWMDRQDKVLEDIQQGTTAIWALVHKPDHDPD